MPLPFAIVCDLLQSIDDNRVVRSGQRVDANIIKNWFEQHRGQLHHKDVDPSALLSTLLPEKRTDRVYGIQAKTLQKKVARAVGVGRSRLAELSRWQTPGSGVDLGDCVEGILSSTPNPECLDQNKVTVEEIDAILHTVAQKCRFSSPAVRCTPPSYSLTDAESALAGIFERLPARDAKWFTRLVLKDFRPVALDPYLVYRAYNPLLPTVLQIQDDFAAAARLLHDQVQSRRVILGPLTKADLVKLVKPALGIKIGRQRWFKGRSIKHCLGMGRGLMSCEKKVDGEYCQIHIDLSKGNDCIRIFSKSGKDSTLDRSGVHAAIRTSLRLGQPSCKFKTGAILEGELVVYSEKENRVLDFDKIRKYVHRSGTFLHTEQDSQQHHWEHLMIIYFDILLTDNESLLPLKHSERFKRLTWVVDCKPGVAQLVQRQIIDFRERDAAITLQKTLGRCIVSGEEGLVLKADDPYFDFSSGRQLYGSCNIKIKKEYFQGFGDVGDFAVVGGRYDPVVAKAFALQNIKWTHFYLGCLANKEDVCRWDVPPRFVIVNVVDLNASLMETFRRHANPEATPESQSPTVLQIEPGVSNGKRPTHVFANPPVCDVRCFSFHKSGNTGFWTMRFPAVTKFHFDRSILDAMSFSEFQELAEAEKGTTLQDHSQELEKCIALLDKAEPKGYMVRRMSQSTATTITSPRSSRSRETPPPAMASSPPPTHPPDDLQTPRKAIALPAKDVVTLPRSFALEPSHKADKSSEKSDCDLSRKRRSQHSKEDSSSQSKRFKGHGKPPSSLPDSQASNASSTASRRQPLRDITADSSLHSNIGSTAHHTEPQASSENRIPMLADKQMEEVASLGQTASAAGGHQLVTVDVPTSSTRIAGECEYAKFSCPFATCSAVLAPSIVANAGSRVDEVLRTHGITSIGTDPEIWRDDWTPTPVEIAPAGPADFQKVQSRKLAFVNARQREETKEVLQSIEDVNLELRVRWHEWVEVYDWGVLEALAKQEDMMHSGDGVQAEDSREQARLRELVRMYWVGLV